MKKITVLGPLPPRKWVSQYVDWFVEALWKKVDTQVIDFKNMYPDALYPWWNTKQDWVSIPVYEWVTSEQILVWWNPVSWIKASLSIRWDILHMQYWIWFLAPIYICIWIISKYRSITRIMTIHNVKAHEKSWWKNFIDKCVYGFADKYIVHSQENKSTLQEIIGTQKEIMIFSHWIIEPKVEWLPKSVAKDLLWISKNKRVILFFGNIRPYKGLNIAIEALGDLVKIDSSYTMIIAWKCWEEWDKYDKLIKAHAVDSSIIRIAWFLNHTQISQVFSASDMMILPYTHFDAQSWVVALWLWYWLPMIVSDLWWLTDIISESSYIASVWSSSDLVKKINLMNVPKWIEYIKNTKNEYSRKNITEKYLIKLNTFMNN